MISVIVPVYNVEKYLRKCLDSIVNQTYHDLEIILVDDGSTDGSGAICDEYAQKDNRIKVIHKENGGLSSARNAGMDFATGEYIGFVDSDDYIEIDMYDSLFDEIQRTNTDVCMCGCKIVSEWGDVLYESALPKKIYDIDEILQEIILPLNTAAWNKLYLREAIGSARFPEGKIHGEDLIFILRFLSSKIKFSAIDAACYHYIKHENSITTSKFSNKSFDEVYCKDEAFNLVAEKFPAYKQNALIWRFRARMNIVRRLSVAKLEEEYIERYLSYRRWLIENYKCIADQLSLKEKIEFKLFKLNDRVYSMVVKRRYNKR